MADAKRFIPVVYWALNSIEALGTFVILASIPPDPKNAFLAGFSALRLFMLTVSIALTLAFAVLAWASREGGMVRRWLSKRLNTRATGWGVLSAGLLLAGCILILFLTPPRLQGAAIERLQPFLILGLLMAIQGLAAFWYCDREKFQQALSSLRQDLSLVFSNPLSGYGFLALSFFVGLLTVYFSYYNMGDEGDTITVGWLIAQGDVLYRDIFSHHFPFPYVWVGLVVRLFGNSILAVRLSVVVLRTISFAMAMRYSRWYGAGGLAVLVWSLISPLFLGNMLLYDTFGALLLAPAVLVVLAILCGKAPPIRSALVFVGVMLGLAVLSDPVTAVPSFLLLCATGIVAAKRATSRRERARLVGVQTGLPLLVMVGIGLISLLILVITGSLKDFFRQVLWFNQVIYHRYGPMPGISDLFRPVVSGLDLMNPYWRSYTGLYYEWTSYAELDQWVFTSLFFRLAVIGLAVFWLCRRAWMNAALAYLLGAALLWRASYAWHAQSFIFYAVICAAVLIEAGLSPGRVGAAVDFEKVYTYRVWTRRVGRYAVGMGILALGLMFFWLGFRGGQFWWDHRKQLGYEQSFSGLDGNGAFYRSITCHQPDARILIYPGRMLDYFAAELRPASRYMFLFPWVAEIGEEEVISDLERMQDTPVFVYVEKDISIWKYPVKKYLNKLLAFLDQTYIETEPNIYLSPELKRRCDMQRQK